MKHTLYSTGIGWIGLVMALAIGEAGMAADVVPPSGPFAGGNSLLITNCVPAIGNGLDITNVVFGGAGTTNILGQGTNWVRIIVPAHAAGVVDIVIQSGSGDTTLTGAYTYNPAGIIADSVLPGPAVACGGYHSLGLKADGTIVAWGLNNYGQTDVPAPNSNFTAVAGGGYHSLGLKADRTIVTWGDNYYGQTNIPAPNSNFTAVAGGGDHSLGLKADGTIVAWGLNDDAGQTNVPAPNSNFTAIAGGGYHSLGLKADGTIVAWGLNDDGQTNVPAPNSNFTAVACGGYHSLGLKADGTIVAWGYNTNGQTDVPAPNSNFTAVACGSYHSLGLKTDGTIVAWGYNTYGQTNVPAPNSNFMAVAGGFYHSLGLKADGTIVAWGWNNEGQTNVPAPNTNFGIVPAIDPASGSCAGGYPVTIQGSNLCDGADVTNVTLCGVSAAVQNQSATQIVVTAGVAASAGPGDVRVFSTSFGETVKSNAFTYNPAITAGAGPHGAVAPSGVVDVAYGGTTSFVATADAYYHIGALATNGVSVAEATNRPVYTSVWENVTATGTLIAAFAENLTTNTDTPEWWLAQYGWTNNFDTAATNDADGDRMPAWAEYWAGTDPTNRSSFLGFDYITPEASGTGIVVRWQSVDGKFYRLERGTNLLQVPAFNYLLRTNILGIAPLNTETDATAVGQGPWFYRIKLEP